MIDCESPSVHKLRWYELLERLVENYKNIKNSVVKINFEGRYTEKLAAKSFEEDIIKIYESKKRETILIIFDEIERISPYTASSPHWSEGFDFIYFWQTLRAFYQKHNNIYTYMLVGTNPKCVEESQFFEHDNPIYASFSVHYLPNFTVDQVIEMVGILGKFMGLNFGTDICSMLQDDCGGHPFLIRQMCSYIHVTYKGNRPFKIDKASYKLALEDYRSNLQKYFDMMLNVLGSWYPDEFEMLVMLALEDFDSFYDFARDNPNMVFHLVEFGLLQKNHNDMYVLGLESLGKYLKEKNKFKKINISIEGKQQEISMRRNRLEKELRNIVLSGLKFKYGKKSQEELLRSIPSERRQKLSIKAIEELLSIKNSPLYLLDLKAIIEKNWDDFKNIFDDMEKSRFSIMIDDINKYRVDAHSKDIDREDFEQLRLHFSKLEKVLGYS